MPLAGMCISDDQITKFQTNQLNGQEAVASGDLVQSSKTRISQEAEGDLRSHAMKNWIETQHVWREATCLVRRKS